MTSPTDSPDAPRTTPGGGIVPTGSLPRRGLPRRVLSRVAQLAVKVPAIENQLLLRMRQSTPASDVAPGVQVSEETVGDVAVTWLAPELRDRGVLLFLHGGGYVSGPFGQHWRWLAEIQRSTGVAIGVILYRMPPAAPFPAALEDSVGAVRALQEAGVLAEGQWVLSGDSAGGGLALAVSHALRDAGGPLPSGLLLTAPWVDLELAHTDLLAHQGEDHGTWREDLLRGARRYADGVPLDDPRLSPVNAPMAGLPPVHLNVGTRDLFLPDVMRLREALLTAGVEVSYVEQEEATHTYPQQITTPEARWTIGLQAAWLRDLISVEPA